MLGLRALTGAAAAEPITIQLIDAGLDREPRTGAVIVTFTMSKASQAAFARFTQENMGRKVEFRVDGKTVSTPLIREPILSGSGQISGVKPEEARDLAARLSSGQAKLQVERAP